MSSIHEKKEKLAAILTAMESAVVAFSGGVDSTFLLQSAKEALGDRVMAVTARSSTYPERELSEAEEFAKSHGIRHRVIVSEELSIEQFAENPPNRCYLCKKELFSKILAIAAAEGFRFVTEGSNCDDTGDYRPGLIAISELGVRSPLREAGLTKQEIRALSQEMGLPTWNKPSFACLSSRVPYGERITPQKLAMIDKAEQYLRNLGFRQLRVRHHGEIARIELAPEEMPRVFAENLAGEISQALRAIGFLYVSLDLAGYRMGSMNDRLPREEVAKTAGILRAGGRHADGP